MYIISLDTFMLLAVLGITLGLILIVVNTSIKTLEPFDPKKIKFNKIVLDNYIDKSAENEEIQNYVHTQLRGEYKKYEREYPDQDGKLRLEQLVNNRKRWYIKQIRESNIDSIGLIMLQVDLKEDSSAIYYEGQIRLFTSQRNDYDESVANAFIKKELKMHWKPLWDIREKGD